MFKFKKKDAAIAQNKAEQLRDLRALKADIERQETELKAWFMETLGDERAAEVGAYLVLISDRTRVDLDKEALKARLGDGLAEFEREKSYRVLEVKLVK